MPEPALVDRLLALVEAYPGLHVRELARQLGTSVALVEYHLEALERQGKVELRPDLRYRRAYLRGAGAVPAADRKALDLLRRRLPLRIVLELLNAPGPLRHAELAERLGMGKSKLSFHLQALEQAGLVERDGAGALRAREAGRLRRLLERWKPTPDVLSEFEDAWSELYRG
jgi:predicted ArsR family transcriptional regulator